MGGGPSLLLSVRTRAGARVTADERRNAMRQEQADWEVGHLLDQLTPETYELEVECRCSWQVARAPVVLALQAFSAHLVVAH
jgi:hypothetical protein